MALCLPALLPQARDGRRAQCQNNEHNIALALTQYVDRFGVFPMSAVEGEGRGHGQSCFMMIMPYLDDQDLYDAYNFSLENWSTESNRYGVSNAVISRCGVSVLRCPDNPFVEETPSSQIMKLNGSFYSAALRLPRAITRLTGVGAIRAGVMISIGLRVLIAG
ncbi:MAG: DUF1559 domain-containing protein [Isosphaeraceae bacterium]